MKDFFRKCDKPLFFATLVFSILGLLMVFSSSSIISSFSDTKTPYYYFIRQLGFVTISYILGYFIANIPLSKYKKFIKMGLIINILLLVGLFIFAKEINGAKSWYNLKIFNFQPSEFAKIFIIIYYGFFFHAFQNKTKNKKNENSKDFVYPLIYGGIVVSLIFLQPDFGTSVIITALIIAIYYFLPLTIKNKLYLVKLAIITVIIGGIVIYINGGLFTEAQKRRFNFKQPCTRYVEETGYQLCNSFIAINNGGLSGVGLSNSTQKFLYLPAGHTDFIFSIITEELGSIRGTLIIIGYAFILYRIYKISRNATNLRSSIIALGAFIVIALHVSINLAGITGLIPLTGVPLPLLSYGGSFTISTYILLFLVQNVAIETKRKTLKKEMKQLNK